MDNLFKILFCNDVNLTQLSYLLDQDENKIIDMVNGTIKMTKEEKSIIEGLIGQKLNI